MTGTFHIVLAMKPCDGSFAENALRHGVSGIGIDATRIVSGGENPKPCRAPGWDSINASNATAGYRDDDYQQGGSEYMPSNLGRFPANIILGHSDGCRKIGMKKVAGNTGTENRAEGQGRYGEFSGATKGKTVGYTDENGMEAVEEWECEADCAVRLLGEQSGELKSGTRNGERKAHDEFGTFTDRERDSGYFKEGDSGTASRFFKQIEEFKEDDNEESDSCRP